MEQSKVSTDGVNRDVELFCGVVCGQLAPVSEAFKQPAMPIGDQFCGFHTHNTIRTILHENARMALCFVHKLRSFRVMATGFPTTNPGVRINSVDVLSDSWYTLRRVDFDYRTASGEWSRRQREAYDRGNGATVLLVDWQRETVVLTKQFRIPAYMNKHPDGLLVETPAGLLDEDDAETAIRREVEEETGYRVGTVVPLFELFMSPGSVTERVSFFVAEYSPSDRVALGGGVEAEGEEIEVLELTIDDATEQLARGRIVDGKTVLLLQWVQLERSRRHLAA